MKKSVLRIFGKFTRKHLCLRPEACNFIQIETLAQVFYCEFCEISKNIFLQKTYNRRLMIKQYSKLKLAAFTNFKGGCYFSYYVKDVICILI